MSEARTSDDRPARMLPALAAALVAVLAWWASRPYAVGVFHDDGVYAILAKSVATGHGYRFLHLPGAPAATHYPPGYPLLLAALWRLGPAFPANVSLFLLANALLLGLAALGIAWFAERGLGWPRMAAVAAALVATVSTPLLMLSGLVLSETLFVAMLFPVLMAGERLVRDTGDWRRAVAVGVGAGALGLVRTHALALAVALVLVLAARRQWRTMALCACSVLLALAPWELWLAMHRQPVAEILDGSYGPYGAWLVNGMRGHVPGFVTRTMFVNVRETGATLADHFAIGDAALPRLFASILAAGAIVAGAWRLARRAPVFVAFAVVYTIVLLAWPFAPWRFVFAAWPLVVLCIGGAIEWVACAWGDRTVAARAVQVAGTLSMSLVIAGAVREEGRAYVTRSWTQPTAQATARIVPLVGWVNARTEAGDVVAVDGEQLVYLFTSRQAVPIAPFTAAEYVHPRTVADDAASIRRLLADYPVKYLLTISPALRASADLVAASGGGAGETTPTLVPVASLNQGEVYRVQRRADIRMDSQR